MKPIRVSLAIVLLLGLSTLLTLAAGCTAPKAQASGLDVTYYYRPGCAVCAKAAPEVAALPNEFPGQVRVKTVDATSPEGLRAIQQLELEGHGLVIRSARGFVLWKQPQHDVKMSEVRQQLRTLLSTHQTASL